MDKKLSEILADLRSRIERVYGSRLERLILFGSQARRDAMPESDIDVLIVLSGEVRPGLEIARTGAIIAALSLHYDVVISSSFIAAERYRGERSPFLLNVQRDGIAL
jgi:predicted nucleotidyltransferase